MPKVIVADIDNTLVSKHEEMSEKTKDAIKKLNEYHILFGIASGRPYCQVNPLINDWGVDVDFVIGANGCELVDLKNNITKTFFLMKPEWFKEIIDFMQPFKANAMMVIDGIQNVQFVDEDVISSSKYMNKHSRVIKDISEYYIENSKIMFRVDPKQMDKCEKYVNAHPSKHYKGFKTQPYLMEFANKDVSKAYALKQYCDSYGISLDDVWAFGDTTNDNDMLMASGRGICMLNGSIDTKEIADEITEKTCKEDGFADYINKNIFEGEK